MATVYIQHGREKSIRNEHPWVFRGAIGRIEGSPQNGETVNIRTMEGDYLAKGAYSHNSQIAIRILITRPNEEVNADFFRRKIRNAIELRRSLRVGEVSSAYRIIHGESDAMPGWVIDQYNDWLVVQILSAGAEYWREQIIPILAEETGIRNIYERSDVDVRVLEGLAERSGLLLGTSEPEPMVIEENQIKFMVDLRMGQKTGFYLDQRNNRKLLGQYAAGKKVLNCFCYTGGFSMYAMTAGASQVTSIDSSGEAIDCAKKNMTVNHLDETRMNWMDADVFQTLRLFRDKNEHFDCIVLDPPKFAPTAAQVDKAARAYKDINLLAFKLLNPGGILFTFSCSGGVSTDLFQKIVAGAALDAGVHAKIIHHMNQGPDHPIGLNFPEGAYLKGLVCQRD